MKNSNLIEIASFAYPHEAHIAKANLESAEIPSFIINEHLVNMQWLYANAVGGVQLLVPKMFAAEAQVLLATDFSDSLHQQMEFNETVCPCCGSTNNSAYTIGKKAAFVVFLLLGFPLFFYKRGIKCLECGTISQVDSETGRVQQK